jgi:hypothetical protein
LEIQGAGLGLVRDDISDVKSEMAALGASYLVAPKKDAETVESIQLRNSAANSPLAKICSSVEKGLTQALRWIGLWEGADPLAIEVRLNKDFDKTRLSPDDLVKLNSALQAGGITVDTYVYLLNEAEILPPGTDLAAYAMELQAAKQPTQQVQQTPTPPTKPTV